MLTIPESFWRGPIPDEMVTIPAGLSFVELRAEGSMSNHREPSTWMRFLSIGMK